MLGLECVLLPKRGNTILHPAIAVQRITLYRLTRCRSAVGQCGCRDFVDPGGLFGPPGHWSCSVDHDDLTVFNGGHADHIDILDRGAVTRNDLYIVDPDRAGCGNEISLAVLADGIFGAFAGLQRRGDDAGIGPDGQRVVVVLISRSECDGTSVTGAAGNPSGNLR